MPYDLQPFDIDCETTPYLDNVPEAAEEHWTMNFGPQHPSTHTTLRLVLQLDGERQGRVARPQARHCAETVCDERLLEIDQRRHVPNPTPLHPHIEQGSHGEVRASGQGQGALCSVRGGPASRGMVLGAGRRDTCGAARIRHNATVGQVDLQEEPFPCGKHADP